jgi:transcriptional regulator with XRE-family HTH domain
MDQQQHPSPAQMRAGRALLGWSQQQLAERSGVGRRTVAEFENGGERVSEPSIAAMRQALEVAGIRFASAAGNEGVERARP